MSKKIEYWTDRGDFGYWERPQPIPKGWHKLERPKPPTSQYSYSNEASQGALIAKTSDFPSAFDPSKQEYACAYSDRMWSWDEARMKRACAIAGGGDAVWAYRLKGLSDAKLIDFAKVALDLEDKNVTDVRVVHYYNVATGYSCPTVEALYDKESK